MNTELDKRLLCVASFVRKGAFLIDVGTDHAYLPIALMKKGIIRGAIASDINEGPCERARINISKNGFESKISVRRTDGLCGIYPDDGMTDIVIAGMGGALITEILDKSDITKKSDVRLILQPMRNVPDLRKYLCENGFYIAGEALSSDGERIYETEYAVFDGKKHEYTELTLLLGEKNIENKRKNPDVFSKFCEKTAGALLKKISGMRESGADVSSYEALRSFVLSEKEM
ncbi:MAG: tRNA (adenine(22)-N(1))-methyltransferase [Eubacteriales bacterium]